MRLHCFRRDIDGASAVEFALVAAPFLLFVLGIIQVGVYWMVQSALDTAIIRTADGLRNTFTTGTNPTMPSASALKASVAGNSGNSIKNDAQLAVEIRPLADLSSASVPITDGTATYGSSTSTLALRAQAPVPTFAPGFSALTQVRSSAILRRQGT